MIGFGIDQIQAEYVAEIKLRHFNREYILKRIADIEELERLIADLEDILQSRNRVKRIIVDELKEVAKKHGKPRRSQVLYLTEAPKKIEREEEEIPNYPCTLFFSEGGYFKKIQPNSLRMNNDQKYKEGDKLRQSVETTNDVELLFFSSAGNVYKTRANDFADTKASLLGDYVPGTLDFDAGENAIYMVTTRDYSGYMLFFFENGKVAKVELSAYATQTRRRKLVGAYSDKSPLVAVVHVPMDAEFMLTSASGRRLLLHTGAIAPKTTRTTIGVQVMTLKGSHRLASVEPYRDGMVLKPARYRTKSLPAAGAMPLAEDIGEQLTLG